MADERNNDWSRSVGAVVIKDGKVLLARHTYGNGKGLLIVPGGYINHGELPEEACAREVFEETGVEVKAKKLIGVRFSEKDWYCVFLCEYLSGDAHSDNDENSEVVWLEIEKALSADDVPDLSRQMIKRAYAGFEKTEFISKNPARTSLYTTKED